MFVPPPLPAGISVRTITSADIPALIEIHQALLPYKYNSTFFTQVILHHSRLGLIAYEDEKPGVPIGFITATITRPPDYPPRKDSNTTDLDPVITLLTLGVKPDFQRHGIARRLVVQVAAGLDPTCNDPIKRVSVLIRAVNEGARKFYEELGCSDEGTMKNYFRTLCTSDSDAVKITGSLRVH